MTSLASLPLPVTTTTSASMSSSAAIVPDKSKDVVFGLGGQLVTIRKGSMYRGLIESLWEEYCSNTSGKKLAFVGEKVVNHVLSDVGGRFLMFNRNNKETDYVQLDPLNPSELKTIHSKIQQAFRDRKKQELSKGSGEKQPPTTTIKRSTAKRLTKRKISTRKQTKTKRNEKRVVASNKKAAKKATKQRGIEAAKPKSATATKPRRRTPPTKLAIPRMTVRQQALAAKKAKLLANLAAATAIAKLAEERPTVLSPPVEIVPIEQEEESALVIKQQDASNDSKQKPVDFYHDPIELEERDASKEVMDLDLLEISLPAIKANDPKPMDAAGDLEPIKLEDSDPSKEAMDLEELLEDFNKDNHGENVVLINYAFLNDLCTMKDMCVSLQSYDDVGYKYEDLFEPVIQDWDDEDHAVCAQV